MSDFDDTSNEDRAIPEPRKPYFRIRADDPRWALKPPYNWRPLTVQFGGFCWYCGERIEEDSRAFYSPILKTLAHFSCRGGED